RWHLLQLWRGPERGEQRAQQRDPICALGQEDAAKGDQRRREHGPEPANRAPLTLAWVRRRDLKVATAEELDGTLGTKPFVPSVPEQEDSFDGGLLAGRDPVPRRLRGPPSEGARHLPPQ